MRKMIAGLAAGVLLALGGVANADCVGCDEYDVKVSVNGNSFDGKWTIVDDRPYVGLESLSNILLMPRTKDFLAHNLGGTEGLNPLEFGARAGGQKLNTIRFAGVTMVDLYEVASALDLPVHHNFRNKTIQIGSNYTGEEMKGKWYRYFSRVRGYRLHDDIDRVEIRKKLVDNNGDAYRTFDDHPRGPRKRI